MSEDKLAWKNALREKMLTLEAAELKIAQEHYDRFLEEAKLDAREQHDNSELAEARENADLAAAFDHPVKDHHSKIDVLETMDFSLKDTVEPGAVVAFGTRRVVVSVSTAEFDVDGVSYMGISPQSPIYLAMVGLSQGDNFTFNGRDVTIEEVF